MISLGESLIDSVPSGEKKEMLAPEEAEILQLNQPRYRKQLELKKREKKMAE